MTIKPSKPPARKRAPARTAAYAKRVAEDAGRYLARVLEIFRSAVVIDAESAVREVALAIESAITAARAAVSIPDGAMTGALEDVWGATSWRARVTEYLRAAARAIADGEDADAVMRTLDYQMRRIATSEAMNAARENALTRAMKANGGDTSGVAIQWATTSANPCAICIALEETDEFGYGPGLYRVDAVPEPPHSFCRCRWTVVVLTPAQLAAGRRTMAVTVRPGLTRAGAARVRSRVHELTRGASAMRTKIKRAM